MTGRDSRIDNAKGVLIILVVLGHMVWPVPNRDGVAAALYFFIYFFHMPMFALISGYLSRAEAGWQAAVGNARLLLVPYAVFVVIHWLVQTAAGVKPYPVLEGHYGLWFLLSLFCWRVMLPYVARIPHALPASIAAGVGRGLRAVHGHGAEPVPDLRASAVLSGRASDAAGGGVLRPRSSAGPSDWP